MRHLRCKKCDALVIAAVVPEACMSCGASGEEAYPQAQGRWNPAAQATLELDQEDLEESPLVPPPPTGLQSQTTLELSEEDLEESLPVPPPPTGLQAVSTNEMCEEALEELQAQSKQESRESPPTTGLQAQTTLELAEEDLEESVPPAPPPPSTGLIAQTTEELEEEDLQEVPEPPPSPPAKKPSLERRPDGVRVLSGRVAYPVTTRTDHTPVSRMSKEVNETAVAGLPPQPPKSDKPLASQIESLKEIRQRLARRKLERAMWGVACVVLLAAVIGGIWYLISRPQKGAVEVVAHTVVPDGVLVPVDSGPGRYSVDQSTPADQGIPEQRMPDQGTSDTAHRSRPHVRVKRPPKEPRPGPTPVIDRAARSELARRSYQEGLRLLFRGQAKVAIQKFNRALKQDPSFHMAFRGLGLAYEKVGRKAMAGEAFKRYLILNPSAPDAAAIKARIKTLTK